jgi:hypothetical protein
MSESEIQVELRNFEAKLQDRYSLFSKLFVLITIVLIILVLAVFLGIIVYENGYNWAGLSLEGWILGVCLIVSIFIILELVLYYHYNSVKHKRIGLEKPKPEFIDGRRIFVYTFPKGVEGGIFSKTYIEIDNNNVIRLRVLMIPPNEL